MAVDDQHIDLILLQERCRKDPVSYREEYVWQQRHFQALLTSARLQPSEPCPRLGEVASFIGAVSHCYGNDCVFVTEVVSFLTDYGPAIYPDLRRALVRLLGLLRARNSADPVIIIPLFFRLLECKDKLLRRMMHGHIVADIKKIQSCGHTSHRALQSFLFGMVNDPNGLLGKRSLHILVDLFRKKIWNDSKCANMIAHACFHPAGPVAIIATKFLLDSESKDDDQDSDDEEDAGSAPSEAVGNARDGRKAAALWKAYSMTGKKSSKKRKRMERVISRVTRDKSKTSTKPISEESAGLPSFEAMMLLNDPQDFVERLFSDLQTRRRKESYEIRLLFINLITRLVGTHRLILFNLYPFLQRYLQPSQPEVTRVLAYLTQACHDLVPADVLHPILRGLADTFVSERSSPPAMAAGINTIRAICARVPLAILDEENDTLPAAKQEAPLLLDLVQYKSAKDKGVVMAARSLIALYREVNPSFLQKRDRGKAGAVAVQKGNSARPRAYGEHLYATGVEGVELLHEKDTDEEDDKDNENSENSENSGSSKVDDDQNGGMASDVEHKVEDGTKTQKDIAENYKSVGVVQKMAADGEKHVKEDASSDASNGGSSIGCGSDSDEEENNEDADSPNEIIGEAVGHLENDNSADQQPTLGQLEASHKRIDELRILTDEDYARIRARQAARAIGESALTTNTGDAVDPDDIQGPLKRPRRTLAERLESVMEGREGREKFGSRKGLNKGGGSTNKKKLKSKSNSMVIHKRRNQSKRRGRREKQISKRRKKDYR